MADSSATPSRIPRLALQLYSLRSLALPFETQLRRAAEAGYSGVETVGTHGLDAERAAAALAATGVSVCSSHVALDALENDLASVCRFQLAVGNTTVVVPWLPPELRGRDADSWQALGRRLGALGRRCRRHGVRLLYHNHDFELAAVDGRPGLGWLLEAAAPDELGLEPDLGWIRRAGLDPASLLAEHSGRCPRVHLKDVARPGEQAGEGGWADIGDGVLEWDSLLPACRDAGAEWYVVEHDAPRDPLASARRSARALAGRL